MRDQEYSAILVGIDGSDQAFEAFKKAVEVGRRNAGKVIVTHVIENRVYGVMGYSTMNANLLQDETDEAKRMLDEYKDYAKSVGYDKVEAVLTFGSPKIVMCEDLTEKYDVDLIMVGQSGLNAVERFMTGSVSDYIIRNAPCDVLIVRPDKSADEKKKSK